MSIQSWHHNWLAMDDQHNRYLEAWCELNGRLEREPGWFALTNAEKDAAQHASGLSEVEALLRILHRRLGRSLRKMPTSPSRDFDAVLANLRVAERLSPPEEHAVVQPARRSTTTPSSPGDAAPKLRRRPLASER